MARDPALHRHDPTEEWVNIVTHGIGMVMSVVGMVALLIPAFREGSTLKIVCFATFTGSMVLLYGSSTVYHFFYKSPFRHRLRILDHAAIYLLIAGTYTPYSLLVLPPPWDSAIFILIWVMALAGVLFKLFFTGRFNRLSAFLYLAMGWTIIVAIKPLWEHIPNGTLFWVAAGGFCYTVGVVFYLWEKLKFNHGIWHLFVLGGTFCHFMGVYLHLLPMQGK